MKRFILVLVLTLGIAGFSKSMEAATMYTAPLFAAGQVTSSLAFCAITNISSSDITVTIALFNQLGTEIDSDSVTISPGNIGGVSPSVASGMYYCRFVVPNAGRVRANLQILDSEQGVVSVRASADAK